MPTLVRGETLRIGGLAVEDGSNVLHEPSHDWVIDRKTATDVSFHSFLQSPQQLLELFDSDLGDPV